MSFCKPIPAPLRKTLWKLVLIYGIMSLFGLAYGAFGQDTRLCLLSLTVGVIGTVKFFGLLDRINSRRFSTYQCVVLSDRHAGLHYECVIATENPFKADQELTDNN